MPGENMMNALHAKPGSSLGGMDRRSLLLSLTAGALASQVPGVAHAVEGGPCELLVSYRCKPANRPAFRTYLVEKALPRLEAYKRAGHLASFQVLFCPLPNQTWDALLILSFARYADTQFWKDIERTQPGGLDAAGLQLAQPDRSYSADLAWQAEAADPGPEAKRVIYAIPYTYNVLSTYKDYVEGYVVPQVKGWMAEGVLSRYRFYLNRFPVGDPDPWDALFIYDYRDIDSFGRREEVLQKVRQTLKSDPVWTHWSDIKATIRTESENTIADILKARS